MTCNRWPTQLGNLANIGSLVAHVVRGLLSPALLNQLLHTLAQRRRLHLLLQRALVAVGQFTRLLHPPDAHKVIVTAAVLVDLPHHIGRGVQVVEEEAGKENGVKWKR